MDPSWRRAAAQLQPRIYCCWQAVAPGTASAARAFPGTGGQTLFVFSRLKSKSQCCGAHLCSVPSVCDLLCFLQLSPRRKHVDTVPPFGVSFAKPLGRAVPRELGVVALGLTATGGTLAWWHAPLQLPHLWALPPKPTRT